MIRLFRRETFRVYDSTSIIGSSTLEQYLMAGLKWYKLGAPSNRHELSHGETSKLFKVCRQKSTGLRRVRRRLDRHLRGKPSTVISKSKAHDSFSFSCYPLVPRHAPQSTPRLGGGLKNLC